MKTNLENYEERFVDYMEGQLDATEMQEVEAFVAQHPELEEDFKLSCSTKLVPDTNVVFAKKESLMKPVTKVRPLWVRIVAAAACVALLIGVGIRFLKPHQGLVQQPLLAELAPIKAQPIGVDPDGQVLRKSQVKAVTLRKAAPQPKVLEEAAPIEMIADVEPLEMIAAIVPTGPKPLETQEALAYDDIEIKMFVELGERLTAIDPIALQEPIALRPWDGLFDNVQETTKTLYKRTAKTVMGAYYWVDYHLNEAKDQLMASR